MYQGSYVFPLDDIMDANNNRVQYRSTGITVEDYMLIEFTKAMLMSPYMAALSHDELVKEAYKYTQAVLKRSANPSVA